MPAATLHALPLAQAPLRKTARWSPGAAQTSAHTEIFAAAGDATGAALALAFAADTPAGTGTTPATAAEAAERPWLWVQDRAARRLSGVPCRAGLPLPLRHRLIHVAADKPEDALFALEEALRCRDLAFVVGEIAGNPKALSFTASRRLSLAAEKHGVPLWLVRLDATRDLGSARMRWQARAAASPPPRWNPQAPGIPRWQAELFRAHLFAPGQWILADDPRNPAEGLVAVASDTQPQTGKRPDAAQRQPATVEWSVPFGARFGAATARIAADHGDLARQPRDRPLAAGTS